MSESKTAKQAVQAARKSKSGFDYDSSGNLPRLIPMQNGDVLFRDPTDGHTRRLVSGTIRDSLEAFKDHPLWTQIEEELETLEILADPEAMEALAEAEAELEEVA